MESNISHIQQAKELHLIMTDMKYAPLGWSGIKVSKVCLGGMSFGKTSPDFHQWTIDQQGTEQVIGHAIDRGINFIDTANCYAFGTSEEYIGQALRNLNIARHQVVLASKVYFNDGHLSKEAINREIDGTLKRLGTDYLDLYIIHRFDYTTPAEETMEALDALVKAGKVPLQSALPRRRTRAHPRMPAVRRCFDALLSYGFRTSGTPDMEFEFHPRHH